MKLWIFWLSLLAAGALPASASQPPEESSPAVETSKAEFSFAAAALNKYVWRGLAVTNGPVLQPSATLGMSNFIFNAWANMDLGDVNDRQGEFNEVDYTLEYGFKLKDLSLSLGAIHYTFPTTAFNSTTELYLVSGVDILLKPTFRLYKDVDEVKGTYASLALGHSLPLDFMQSSLDFSASLGWGSKVHNRFYYGAAKNSCADLNFGVSVPFSFKEKYSLTPSVGYSGMLSGSMRNLPAAGDHFLAGVTFSSNF